MIGAAGQAAALALPFAFSAVLSWIVRSPDLQSSSLLITLVRIFTAGAAAGLHVTWLKAALDRHAV